MPAKSPQSSGPQRERARAIDRRSFLAAAPAAGLAAGGAALVGRDDGPPGGADLDRHLDYRETPHIRAYYRLARY